MYCTLLLFANGKPYNLNKTKALRKKGDNRNMQHLTAELKLGVSSRQHG
jgi:hypothetical protein